MTDEELLQAYEPVLCFAHSERFFPMDVHQYWGYCQLHTSRLGVWGTSVAKKVDSLGSSYDARHFLRFVNEETSSALLITWIVWTLILLPIGFLLGSWNGLQIALWISVALAALLYLVASNIRLRLISAIFVVSLFLSLVYFAARFFFGLENVPLWLLLCFWIPFILVALVFIWATVQYIFKNIIPELPGLVLDLLSNATEQTAATAYKQYKQVLEKDSQPVYYGRVETKSDEQRNNWKILQYHFFYAFNDWRSAAYGINHHEGDWEMASVYLKNDAPYAVLYSQHHDGAMEEWDTVPKVLDQDNRAHPVIYAALGSHANYSTHAVIQAPELFKRGAIQRVIFFVDNLIRRIFDTINIDHVARERAAKRYEARAAYSQVRLSDQTIAKADRDRYVVGLPMEYATGDGVRIGLPQNSTVPSTDSGAYLQEERYARETAHPQTLTWRRVLVSDQTGWIGYPGLWGVKSFLRDESGPPGPKWDRSENGNPPQPRVRWADPLGWLRNLEEEKKIRGQKTTE